MSEFLAVSAFRDTPIDDLAPAVRQYMSAHGVACDQIEDGSRDEALDALIYPPTNGWTVILWPPYFNINDVPLCAAVSRGLTTLTSTVHVYNGDYWTHVLFDRGEMIDRFASIPGYFAEDQAIVAALAESWAGDADRLSAALGTSPEVIRPYLVHVSPEAGALGKAHEGDEFGLDNYWVFTDMWKRIGIAYPDDVGTFERVLRLGREFTDRLPTVADDDL
jgi:hypothetical protein